MKIMKKQVYVQTPKTIESYISSDGFEFASRAECETHEQALGYKGIKVVETAIKDLNDFYEENPMILYKVENEDDWNILVERVWFYRQSEKEYPGPGLYLAVQERCGDYPDEYSIYEYDAYMNNVHHYYNRFCDNMEDAYMKFNI
jgi:hypothetical protein